MTTIATALAAVDNLRVELDRYRGKVAEDDERMTTLAGVNFGLTRALREAHGDLEATRYLLDETIGELETARRQIAELRGETDQLRAQLAWQVRA